MVTALSILLAAALAQDLEPDPDVVPSAGLATENGSGTLWVNPANLAYDPDAFWGVWFRAAQDEYTPLSGAVVGGARGLGAGLRWLRHADGRRDFALDLGLGVALPQRVALGAALHWNLEAERSNYVAFDLSASWRPLAWFGLSAVTRNLGNPGGPDTSLPQTGVGVALRPLGPALVVGADYLHTFGGAARPSRFQLSARVRPTSGLFLRAHLDSSLAFGAGLELAFGGASVGVHGGTRQWEGLPELTAWVSSEERDENIAASRRQVTFLDLRDPPALQPERPVLRRPDPSWLQTLAHFERAAEDPKVRGMVLTLGGAPMSWARWREVRDWIRRLRNAGKPVVVLLTGEASQGAVYAASAASEVFAHPAATLELTGLSVEMTHVKGVLDAVGVDVQVVRRSEYKSAADELARLEPSAANLDQQRALLDDLTDELVDALSLGRQRTEDDVRAWLDGGPYSATEAERIGLIDGRAYPDQLDKQLERVHGGRIRHVNLAERAPIRSPWDSPAVIAVVYVEGVITLGESQPPGLLSGRTAGATTIVAQLEQAARQVGVRAVVVRIDSPGGSAFASDEIWRAVERVKAAGKPVVVSMGGVAASGGYYVASGADAVWAEPTTVTGSIGVLAVKTSFGPLLDTLGVRVTRLESGRNAGLDSPWRPWDPLQLARMDALVADTYQRFKERVAAGRGLAPEEVERVARGRVWSGARAREAGLVDHLGGFTDALDHARRLAGIPDRQPVEWQGLEPRRGLLQRLLGRSPRVAAGAGLDQAIGADLARALAPAEAWWTLTRHDEDSLWMIDPWWTAIGPR